LDFLRAGSRQGEPLGSWQQRAEHLQQAVQPGDCE
jgi:hypothetical protein